MAEDDLAAVVASVIDHVAEAVVVLDEAATVRYMNEGARRLLGLEPPDWVGRSAFDAVHPDDLPLTLELMVSARATGSGVKEPVVYRLLKSDGEWMPVEAVANTVELANGELVIVLSGRPASVGRPDAEIVSEVSTRLSNMFEDAAIGMTQTALDGRMLRVNPRFAAMLDQSPRALVGQQFTELVHPDDRDRVHEGLDALASERIDTFSGAARYVVDGRTLHTNLTASLVRDHRGDPMYWATQTIDVSDRVAAQEELLHRSTHDSLTGLANRSLFRSVLDQALARAKRRGTAVAVMFVDLDGFKAVNDTIGHHSGDALLIEVASRLCGAVRADDTVARQGGDEFLVLCEDVTPAVAGAIADRIVDSVRAPIDVGTGSARVDASVGLTIAHAAGVTGAELVRQADHALYDAKRAGGSRVARHHDEAARATD